MTFGVLGAGRPDVVEAGGPKAAPRPGVMGAGASGRPGVIGAGSGTRGPE